MESTHLSRTFSDQGVRLRLRKEPRTLSGSVPMPALILLSLMPCRTKRAWDTTPPESSTPPMQHQTPYGGQVQPDRQYGYLPTVKRQRSDSDYSNPNAYPAAQYASSATPQYNTGQAWPVQHPQSLQTNFPNAYGSMLPQQGHPQSATSSIWARTLAQSSFSAPATAMGTSSYFNTNPLPNVPRDYQSAPQTQPQGSHYSAQLSGDAYPTMTGSQASSRYGAYNAASEGDTTSRLSDMSSAISQPHSVLSHQDSSSSMGQYRTRPIGANTPYQGYQASPEQSSGTTSFDQSANPVGGQYDQSQFSSPPNPYSDASRDAYSSGRGNNLPNPGRPLDSAMLNRGFATYSGEQAGSSYGDVSDPALGDIQPYHTPHQTRPMG